MTAHPARAKMVRCVLIVPMRTAVTAQAAGAALIVMWRSTLAAVPKMIVMLRMPLVRRLDLDSTTARVSMVMRLEMRVRTALRSTSVHPIRAKTAATASTYCCSTRALALQATLAPTVQLPVHVRPHKFPIQTKLQAAR